MIFSLMLPEANLHLKCYKQEQYDLLQSWLHFSSHLLTYFLSVQCYYGSDSFIWKCHLYMLLYWVPHWLKFHICGFWLNLIWVEYPTVIISLCLIAHISLFNYTGSHYQIFSWSMTVLIKFGLYLTTQNIPHSSGAVRGNNFMHCVRVHWFR